MSAASVERLESPAAARRAARLRRAVAASLPPAATFLLFLVAWEAFVRAFDVPFYLLPAPHQIAGTFLASWPQLVQAGLYTFREALIGFAVGSGAGVLAAVAAGRFRRSTDVLLPLAIGTNAIPIVAFAPLAVVWFGVEQGSKIAIVAVMTFFPTMVSTVRGLRSAPPQALELMRSYAAPERQVFWKLRLPSALPFMFGAFRVGATLSLIGAVVAEFFGGPLGALGVYIKAQAGISHTREAWAAIVVACALGLLFYGAVALVERLAMPWHAARAARP